MENTIDAIDTNAFVEFEEPNASLDLENIDFTFCCDFGFSFSEPAVTKVDIFDVQEKETGIRSGPHEDLVYTTLTTVPYEHDLSIDSLLEFLNTSDNSTSPQEDLVSSTLNTLPHENDFAIDSLMEFLNTSDDSQQNEIQTMKEILEEELFPPQAKKMKRDEQDTAILESFLDFSDISRILKDNNNLPEVEGNPNSFLQNNGHGIPPEANQLKTNEQDTDIQESCLHFSDINIILKDNNSLSEVEGNPNSFLQNNEPDIPPQATKMKRDDQDTDILESFLHCSDISRILNDNNSLPEVEGNPNLVLQNNGHGISPEANKLKTDEHGTDILESFFYCSDISRFLKDNNSLPELEGDSNGVLQSNGHGTPPEANQLETDEQDTDILESFFYCSDISRFLKDNNSLPEVEGNPNNFLQNNGPDILNPDLELFSQLTINSLNDMNANDEELSYLFEDIIN